MTAGSRPGAPDPFRFCPACGNLLATAGRDDGRLHCRACGFIRYRNPAVGAAVVLQDERGQVLMGRRARGDYAGLWCIPCGYVEWNEDVRAAASREFLEETGLHVEPGEIVAVHSNFHNANQHTVGIWFRGRLVGGALHPVDGEFTELAYVDPSAPPRLAFPTDALVCEQLARGGPGQRTPNGFPGGQ